MTQPENQTPLPPDNTKKKYSSAPMVCFAIFIAIPLVIFAFVYTQSCTAVILGVCTYFFLIIKIAMTPPTAAQIAKMDEEEDKAEKIIKNMGKNTTEWQLLLTIVSTSIVIIALTGVFICTNIIGAYTFIAIMAFIGIQLYGTIRKYQNLKRLDEKEPTKLAKIMRLLLALPAMAGIFMDVMKEATLRGYLPEDNNRGYIVAGAVALAALISIFDILKKENKKHIKEKGEPLSMEKLLSNDDEYIAPPKIGVDKLLAHEQKETENK